MGVKRILGIVGGAAMLAAVIGAPQASAAGLPNGYKSVSDGPMTVEIWRNGESATPTPSMASNGAGRSAMLSGQITAKVSTGTGKLRVGYLVGCQVALGNLSAGVSGSFSTAPSVSGSFTLPLAPGEIKAVQLSSQNITQHIARYQYSRLEVEVQGCGGLAQAQSYAKVEATDGYEISTENTTNIGGSGVFVQSTLYGKPFSLN